MDKNQRELMKNNKLSFFRNENNKKKIYGCEKRTERVFLPVMYFSSI